MICLTIESESWRYDDSTEKAPPVPPTLLPLMLSAATASFDEEVIANKPPLCALSEPPEQLENVHELSSHQGYDSHKRGIVNYSRCTMYKKLGT